MIALRIAVATAHGAHNVAPRLAEILARRSSGATFFFNLGPSRGSIVSFLAVKSVRAPRKRLRTVRDAGFEIGLLRLGSAPLVRAHCRRR